MFNKVLIAAAIVIASPALVSAQDIFFSFDSASVVSTTTPSLDDTSGSVYIFSDGLFGFDALDLNFTTSDSSVARFTGGEAFNPTFDIVGGQKFNSSVVTIEAGGNSGSLFSVSVNENGVNPALGALFDPGFDAGVGPNGAVLLARVDFDFVGDGNADFDFTLGPQGALSFPDEFLDPSFGSASLTVQTALKLGYCLGDVNLSGSIFPYVNGVDTFDIAPFIAILSSGVYQFEADIDKNGVVNFLDIAPFIGLLSRQ